MKKVITLIAVLVMSIPISTFAFANKPAMDKNRKESVNAVNIAKTANVTSLPQDIQEKISTLSVIQFLSVLVHLCQDYTYITMRMF